MVEVKKVNNGMKDKVAVVGMGCTKFGDRFEASKQDLVIEAVMECLVDANLAMEDIDVFWFGTMTSEWAGTGLSQYLKTEGKPVTRVENYCCTGTEAFRNACYAVACGAYDVVMAIGMEKLKDGGYSGLAYWMPDCDRTEPDIASPAMFAVLAPAYAKKYGLKYEQLREVLMRISEKTITTVLSIRRRCFKKR
jgi:acetyl-CoA C-acetyltransferase